MKRNDVVDTIADAIEAHSNTLLVLGDVNKFSYEIVVANADAPSEQFMISVRKLKHPRTPTLTKRKN